MRKLRERLKDQKGFTLVEMLLVVAIIAILIAVSIPMVSGTLDRARAAVDDANFRDAAGLGSIMYLESADEPSSVANTYYYYVSDTDKQGKLSTTTVSGSTQYTAQSTQGDLGGSHNIGDKIKVVIAADGNVTVSWES